VRIEAGQGRADLAERAWVADLKLEVGTVLAVRYAGEAEVHAVFRVASKSSYCSMGTISSRSSSAFMVRPVCP
jgi:hypothetical protein